MITTTRVERHGQAVNVRPLTWGELKKLAAAAAERAAHPAPEGAIEERNPLLAMVCPEVNQDELNMDLLRAAIEKINELTYGTDAQRGNLPSTGAGTPPTDASTVTTSAAATATPASA